MTDPIAKANERAMDVAIKVAAQKRLLAAVAEAKFVEACIAQASERIAAGFRNND